MNGISFNKPIEYKWASLRFFNDKEHHVSRTTTEDVLLLVFEGVLRFSENGVEYEVRPGEYFIQEKGTVQRGNKPSDAPKYLYVHFLAEWTDEGERLPKRGTYSVGALYPHMVELDRLRWKNASNLAQASKFYELLLLLPKTQTRNTLAAEIADFIQKQPQFTVSLERLCERFHFSKNHVINLFKRAYGMTPVEYMNMLKLSKAEEWIEVTSEDLETIAERVGFTNYSHFYRLFYRKNRLSPSEWRKQRRK